MEALHKRFMYFITILMILPQLMGPIIYLNHEDKLFENWSPEAVYTSDYAVKIKKNPKKDFVILNLTDIQLKDEDYDTGVGAKSEALIKKLVKEQKPDLITLSGDNAWSKISYAKMVKLIDSFDIPWAPVMGNHDGENCKSEYWCSLLYYTADNCLWKFGPKDMGYGNYIINIEENGKVIHSLFMMDTHSKNTFTLPNSKTVTDYDNLWENQIEWYKWAVDGICKQEGKIVESTVIMHIPVYQFLEVWNNSYNKKTNEFKGTLKEGAIGRLYEKPCSSPVDNGFFDVAKEKGSTKNMIFGHDHINDASIVIDGIRLTYSLKTGGGCYYTDELIGGTTFTINSDGHGKIQHHYS